MKYVCNICGYVYDEELGDVDNVIAVCGVGDSDVMAILVHSIMVGEGCGIDCMGDECHS